MSTSANQLPEADSLPDGFVESAQIPLDSLKPIAGDDYKDEIIEPDPHQDTVLDIEKEKEKVRTFPVELNESDGSGGGETTEVAVSVALDALLVGDELSDKECGSAKEAIEGPTKFQATNLNVETVPQSTEHLQNRNLEAAEVKRKTVKRGFKTEKEFLEFTLKYQQVVAEKDLAISMRNKLESLCRELQRQNKTLMDECKRVSTEGQQMREELSTKFHDAIKDVGVKLEGQKDECLLQLKDNEMLRNKLKHLCDQYTNAEQQFAQKLKHKTLELQLAELKNQRHEEKLKHEQSEVKLYAEQVSELLTTEKTLRLQLEADGEKFKQFQDALVKSNEVFETFKQEIEKMAKSIKELKKENIFLKGKSEKSDVTLIQFVEEREHLKKQLEKVKNQKEKLESLCRSLQSDRKLSGGNNSDPTTVPSI